MVGLRFGASRLIRQLVPCWVSGAHEKAAVLFQSGCIFHGWGDRT